MYGESDGQTQLGIRTTDSEYDGQVFAHPIDVTYACSSLIGRPRLYVEVWEQDSLEGTRGVRVLFHPNRAWMHNIECKTGVHLVPLRFDINGLHRWKPNMW